MSRVESLWLILGILVLGAVLLDVFLTALDYDEAGFIAGRVAAGQWRILRTVTRRMSRRSRPSALRQVTGLQIITVIVVWLFGVILGFGLVYYGLMTPRSFSASGTGAGLTFFDAMYFSAAQLSTVGGSALTAETDLLRFLSIAETLTGVALVSLILTFLLGVYSVVSDLNALCTRFFTAERGAGTVVASLAPYLHDGEPNGLDGHVDGIASSFASYTSGLRLHHSAYYFQSGQDRFALPYALRMLGGTIAALRWGLPTGHPATATPGLVPLTFQFLELGEYLEQRVRWKGTAVPEVVTADAFRRLATRPGDGPPDAWVARFLQLDREMAELAQVVPLTDLDDTYRRYQAWLPFAHRSQEIALAVSRDLDYQPVIVTDRPLSILASDDAVARLSMASDLPLAPSPPADPDETARVKVSRWKAFVDRHVSLVDPGRARLRAAGRATLAAVATVATLALVFRLTGDDAVRPAIFGGFVAMLCAGVAVDSTLRARRTTSVLVAVPVLLVVLLGTLAAGSVLWTGALLVAVAFVGVGAARFGPRWGALGRVTFMAFYFALILRIDREEVVLFGAAVLVGVAWAFLLDYVVLPERPRTVLRNSLTGFGGRIAAATDVLVDAVSWARWDTDVRKRVQDDVRQVHRGAAYLAGLLAGPPDTTGVDPERAGTLRLRVFDAELAVVHLSTAARDLTRATVPLEPRARLAGRLELLQAHLAALVRSAEESRGPAGTLPPWTDERAPAAWPPEARALHRATGEGPRSAGARRAAADAALDPAAVPSAVPRPDASGDDSEDAAMLAELDDGGTSPAADGPRVSPDARRAVQAAVTTGVALAVGDLVSSTHQYWATLAAYQVLGGTDGETFVKGAQRILGTVAGAAVGFAIAIWTGSEPAVVLPLLAVAVFASTFYRPVSPAVSVFWTTMIFALMYEFLGRLTTLAVEIRILETLVGAAIALVVARLVLPTRTREKLDRDLDGLVSDVRVVAVASLGRMGGDDRITSAAVTRRLLTLDQHLRQVNATAAPLRRSVGALEAGGIEAQLTAVWSLVYDTRHLARAVTLAVEAGSDRGPTDWTTLQHVTDDNLAALGVALEGGLPGVVHDDLDADDAPGTAPPRPEETVLRHAERINQTAMLLLSTVSPGAVSASGTRAGWRAA